MESQRINRGSVAKAMKLFFGIISYKSITKNVIGRIIAYNMDKNDNQTIILKFASSCNFQRNHSEMIISFLKKGHDKYRTYNKTNERRIRVLSRFL